MTRALGLLLLALAVAGAPSVLYAQDNRAKSSRPAKLGKDEKLCTFRFSSGETRSWVCKKEQPCCAWDALKQVKCGSTATGCF